MRWLARIRRTAWAAAALAVLGGTLGPVAVTHEGGDDPACETAAAVPRHGSRVDAAESASRPEHCAVCHWLHLLRWVAPASGVRAQAPVGTRDLVEPQGVDPVLASSFPSSGRSPPSSAG